ncbi:uncharacterized protein [Lolium perenne]|uniref:uncharacterized protein isoform X6 n=1 Tax=Lolium perenne TaxID=4522 RepID=UPI0021F56BA6|nr:uncharacterized protein LOC127321595 isoform X6 [Lolium perenne]
MNYEVALPREITTGKCFLQHYIVYSGFTRGHLQTGGGSRGVTLPTSVLILKGKIAGAQGEEAGVAGCLDQARGGDHDSLESISESFVPNAEMQKCGMLQDANSSKFKSQVQSSQMINRVRIWHCNASES